MNIQYINQTSTFTFVLLILLLLMSACSSVKIDDLPEKDQILLKDKSKNYQALDLGQFMVHYQADSYSANQKASFEGDIKASLAKALQVVGVPSFEQQVHFILFPSVEELDKHLDLVATRHWINPKANIGYFVHTEDFGTYFTQNLFQLIAVENWGIPKGFMVPAGGALFAAAQCRDVDYFLDEIGAALFRSGNMMSYRAMFSNFNPSLEANPVLAEIQAAAFFQFVLDNFGIEKIKELWKYGMFRLEGIVFMSAGEVESEILGRWRNYTPTQEVDLTQILKFGC